MSNQTASTDGAMPMRTNKCDVCRRFIQPGSTRCLGCIDDPVRDRLALMARFLAKLSKDGGGCWLWTAAANAAGYGVMRVRMRMLRAHRVSYELHVGTIPDGLMLDHLCRNTLCVNPAHLEPVTQRENVMRGRGICPLNAAKTHCPYGHPYSGRNLLLAGTRKVRKCRQCIADRSQEKNRRRSLVLTSRAALAERTAR